MDPVDKLDTTAPDTASQPAGLLPEQPVWHLRYASDTLAFAKRQGCDSRLTPDSAEPVREQATFTIVAATLEQAIVKGGTLRPKGLQLVAIHPAGVVFI